MADGVTIDKLNLEIEANSKKATKGLEDLAKSLERIKEATDAGLGLGKVNSEIKNNMQGITQAAQQFATVQSRLPSINSSASTSFAKLATTMAGAYATIKKGASFLKYAIGLSNDYIEDVSLFTISMGEYADEAKKYAEEVSEIMGIDPGEWMRNQGIFMTLATGFGVVSDKAYLMSKNLTQLTYDMSSFFNLSFEDAAQKLQSAISGELEPVRRVGYDLSKAALEGIALDSENYEGSMENVANAMSDAAMESFALSEGIGKSFNDMTQAEKSQLRYIALMKQVTVVQGDMARTLDNPANQLRILNAQMTQAGRAIGNIFIPMLNAVLPVAISTLKVIRELADIISGLFGFKMPEVDFEGVKNVSGAGNELAEGFEKATDSAKKLKSYTMGFDELNILNPNSGDSNEDSFGDSLDFKLPEYDFLANATASKVNVIVEEMKEWLGLTEDITSWSDLLDTNLGTILTTVGAIGTGIAVWKIASGTIKQVENLEKSFKEISKNADAVRNLKITAGITLALVGVEVFISEVIESVLNGIDWESAFLIPLSSTLGGAGIGMLIGAAGGPIGMGIGALIGLAIGLITDFTIWLWQKYEDIKKWFLESPLGWVVAVGAGILSLISPIGSLFAIIAGIIVLIKEWDNIPTYVDQYVVQPVVGFFKWLWDKVSEYFTNLWSDIQTTWNNATAWFDEHIIQPIVEFFGNLKDTVSEYFTNLWSDIQSVWNTVVAWFEEHITSPLRETWDYVTNEIGKFFYGCWLIIQAVWLGVSTWFTDIVIIPLQTKFEEMKTKVTTFLTEAWTTIQEKWNEASTWFNETVVQPVVSWFNQAKEDIKQYFTDLWTDIQTTWNSVSTWFNETVVQPLLTKFEEVKTNVITYFTTLKSDIEEKWNDFATKFKTDVIDPLKEKFDEGVENIKGFFSSLWLSVRQGAAGAVNGMIGFFETGINHIIGMINNLISGFNEMVQWAADVLGKDWEGLNLIGTVKFDKIEVPQYALGGFPESGQLFVAREAGAEMVGSIGRKTAVANNEQIVTAVANGVAEANDSQNALLREQNSLLRAILEKKSGVYLDGREITRSVENYQRERGRVLVTGGAT